MRADRSRTSVLRQLPTELAEICQLLTSFAATAPGSAIVEELRATVGGTTTEILSQALFADCLRVVYSAMLADGEIEDHEIAAVDEIIATAARHYASRARSQYAELPRTSRTSSRAFLDCYAADRGPFGRGARIRWPGLMLCRKATELGERESLERYTNAMTSLITEASRLGGVSDDPRGHEQAAELHELKRMLVSEKTARTQGMDPRIQAFLAPCRVFSAVQQASSIFENDPFDVEAVHREARVSFEQLVAQATMQHQAPDLGQMLVVLGDSGAGKTHLLRGFRRHVQEGNRGFVVYAQLQSRTEDYSRYLLFHLVDSLSRRYSEQSGRTGLHELASGLLRLANRPLRARLEHLANDTWDAKGNLADHVNELVDELLRINELESFDRDLLRVLVYALRPDPRTTSSVYKYLHCDDMNAHDRRWIGDVSPRTRDDEPHKMIRALARFAAVTQRALVVMVDQVDLAGFEASSTQIFRRAIDALYRIVSELPSAIAVVACLSDLYNAARAELNRPALDRLENAPPIARLQINRSYAEIKAVVARRLSWLFDEHGTVHRPEQPVYPIPESELQHLENRRLRDVLEWCHQFQAQCAAAGKIINADEPITVEVKPRELDLDTISAAWSEAVQAKDLELPDDEDEILAAVAEAAKAYVHETGVSLDAPPSKNGVLRLKMSRGDDYAAIAIAVVNQGYHRGAFPNGLESLRRRARGMVPIAVRTLEFPRGRACDKAVGQLVNMRGRTAYLDASTLRALVAFQRFQPGFAADRLAAWKLRDRPISSLPAVLEIFDFDRSRVDRPAVGGRRASPTPAEVGADADPSVDAPTPLPPPSATSAPRASVRGPATDSASISDAVSPLVAPARGSASAEAAPPGPSKPGHEPRRRATTGSGPMSTPPAVRSGNEGTPPAEPPGPRDPRSAVERSRPGLHVTATEQLRVGTSASFEAEPVLLDSASLQRHVAVVDGVGSGRIAAALNLVEQALERGMPTILVDRTGEMSGYARPGWWQRSPDPARARQLSEQIDVRLFTPGVRGGRPLSLAVAPALARVPPADHDREIRLAAAAVMARARSSIRADDPERLALLTQAVTVLARRSSPGGMPELIELLETGVDELAPSDDDQQLRQRLTGDLAVLLGNADVFTPGAESLTVTTLLGPTSDGRTPLAIVHTGFLGDGPRLQAWTAQLIGMVSRELVSSGSNAARAMLVLDGADLFLPAGPRNPPAKQPLQELLKRAGTIGLGLVLVSQRPGDIDYQSCAPIETWLVGKADELTVGRMKSLFTQHPLGHRNPSRLEPSRLLMLHDGGAREVERASPLLRIEQLGEIELKSLAARTHPRSHEASVAGDGAIDKTRIARFR
ncbi:MAG: AAA family ATPase [Myxococcales bacterium]|nr:AAA family ATPase [Myxococcales bacterium]